VLAGPIIAYFAKQAKGHGVPEVLRAIALHDGRIRPQVALAKVLASACCIGSGGSAGDRLVRARLRRPAARVL
jgi:CIC family chloride channel protein